MREIHARRIGALLTGLVATGAVAEGGETADDAVVIEAIPYSDSGDTSDNVDDVASFACGPVTDGPDVYYAWTVPADGWYRLTLCGSSFDTRLRVFSAIPNVFSACDDDGCDGSSGNALASELVAVLPAGLELVIVVDGAADAFGPYQIAVEPVDDPGDCATCDRTMVPENEPCADDGSIDVNGGCNSSPEALYTDVDCGDTVCGLSWALGGTRDTDWFRMFTDEADNVRVTLTSSFQAVLYYLDCGTGCDAVCITGAAATGPCGTTFLDACVGGSSSPASHFFVGYDGFDLLPCGGLVDNDYLLSFECTGPCPPPPCPGLGDLDGDGLVGFSDLLILLANWGPCPG